MKAKSFLQVIGCGLALVSVGRSVHAQGLINFNNRVPGVVVAPVYGPEPGGASVAKFGNTSSGTPAGTATYGGALLSGTSYTAELWGGAAGTPTDALARLATTTFRTGTLSGFVVAPASPVAVPGIPPGGMASLQLRVWDNQGGAVSTWTAAQANPRGVASGASTVFTSPPLGDGMLMMPANLTSLRSFNIHLLGPPMFTTSNPLPDALLTQPYDVTLNVANAAPPRSIGLMNGALPPGLAFTSASSGRITGTPTAPGVYRFTAQVTDALGAMAQQAYELAVTTPSPSPWFTRLDSAGLPPPSAFPTTSIRSWGDFNNDGFLDVALEEGLYRNNGNSTFASFNPALDGGTWADFNRDGYLDLLNSSTWRNNGNGTFTAVGGAVATGRQDDFDNDGDLDGLTSGATYRNNGDGTFTAINNGLPALSFATLDVGDYDNDGFLDVLLTGQLQVSGVPISGVYRNNGDGTFTDINAGLVALAGGPVAWGDYDADGFLDFVISGEISRRNRVLRIYHNNGSGTGANRFTAISTSLVPVRFGAAAWGDFDNDGDLDLALTGEWDDSQTGGGSLKYGAVFRNNGRGGFSDLGAGLPGADLNAGLVWVDLDNDGDLDLFFTGWVNAGGLLMVQQIYRNNALVANTPPTAPTGLTASYANGQLRLQWNAATDSQTPSPGLTYNLRVGTTPGGSQIVAPDSLANGRRLVVARGRQGSMNSAVLQVPPGQFYWSVQAVDGAYAGGPFAPEQSFLVQYPPVFTMRGVDSCPRNATLRFTINPGGHGFSYRIVYGPTPAMTLSGPSGGFSPATYGDFPVDLPLTGLTPGTRYYYGLLIMDFMGSYFGARGEFTTAPDPLPPGTGTGLYGDYFNGLEFTGRRAARLDSTVDFDWGNGPPHPAIGADYFSVRWTGKVQPLQTDVYTFYTLSDDGVRLWVNGQLLIDNWTLHGPTENSGSIALVAGQFYDIRMEFFENQIGAVAKLSWSARCSPTKEIVPRTQLYPVPACATAPDGLVGWWPGEGDARELVGQHDGTLRNGVSFIPGKVGRAFNFDGVDDEVSLPHFSDLNFNTNDSFTIEAWLKPSRAALPGERYMTAVSLVSQCAGATLELVVDTSGHAGLILRDSNGIDASVIDGSSPSIVDGLWHHVAVIRDAPFEAVCAIVDGGAALGFPLCRLSDPTTGSFSNAAPQHSLGAVPIPCPTKRRWVGGVDEVRVYRRRLSYEEVQGIHLAGSAGVCRPWTAPACVPIPALQFFYERLLAWWTGDGTAEDRLRLHPGVWRSSPAYAAGEVGSAFYFAGQSSNYVQAPNTAGLRPEPAFGIGGFSMEAWINVESWQGTVVGKLNEYSLSLANGANVMMRMGSGSISGGSGTTGRWHHVAGVMAFSPGVQSVRVYLDGVPVGFASASFPVDFGQRVEIGRGMRGRVDEVCMYSGALTDAQIAALYAAGTGGKCWQPVLSIQPIVPNTTTNVAICWPIEDRGYRLEQTTALPSGTWSSVLGTLIQASNQVHVLLPIASGQHFFRLIAP